MAPKRSEPDRLEPLRIPGASEPDDPAGSLRRERDVLAAIVNSTLAPIVSLDTNGVITSWNTGAERLFGFTAAEALGRESTFLAPERLREESQNLVQALLNGEEVSALETVRRGKDGRLIDVVLSASEIRDAEGRLVGVAAIYQDITDRKAAEREVEGREAQLRDAQRIANLGSWDLDVATGAIEWSSEMYRILGWEPGEIEPSWEVVREMVSSKDRAKFIRKVEESIATGGEFELDVEFVRRDGSVAHLEARGRVTGGTEESPRLSGTALDVTERKRLEQQLIQSQKMEALGGLAGGIAHDFNNLLAVILNYGRFIEEDLPQEHPVREDVREMVRAAERGATLVQQLLSFARREVVRPEPINLNLLLAQMEPLLKRAIAEDVILEMKPHAGLWNTEADKGQIEQLLLNLVVNARDAMPSGGQITIETRNVVADEAFVSARPSMKPGHYIGLIVSDTGTGMDKEIQARIFEPFFTTKGRGSGTGLGLASVYGIVTRAGGDISVYSEVGIGTTFKIYLPLSELAVQDPLVPAQLGWEKGHGEKVVVVEDEEPVLDLITRILRGAGYHPLPLPSPHEALRVMAADREVQLLLTDVIMPEMSGRALSEAAKVPTIFMSGYTDSVIAQQGVLQEGVLFLPKPFSGDELLTIVRSTLDRQLQIDLTEDESTRS